MADIVVVGGCIVDLISYVSRFPKPGETIPGKKFCKGFGGKGANQCVMADRLGARTALIAKLGDDTFGMEYMKDLKESNICLDHVTLSKDSHTSTAAICVTESGQNSIVYVPGAIMKLSSSDVLAAEKVISSAKVLLCTFECPLDTLTAVLKLARQYEVTTVVNAAPLSSESYKSLYPLIDVICLNEVEAEEATGLPATTVEAAAIVIEELMKQNCSTVILTLGSKGAVFQSRNKTNFTHVSARFVNPVDTTGAGDAFMGSLVYYLSEFNQLPLQEMVHRSCEIATISVLGLGTQSSFPIRKDLPEWLFKS